MTDYEYSKFTVKVGGSQIHVASTIVSFIKRRKTFIEENPEHEICETYKTEIEKAEDIIQRFHKGMNLQKEFEKI